MFSFLKFFLSLATVNVILGGETHAAGEQPLPTPRLEEIIFVLQELARLVIHPDTVSVLPLRHSLKEGLSDENCGRRSHLLVLFPSLCELVASRYATSFLLSFSHRFGKIEFLFLKPAVMFNELDRVFHQNFIISTYNILFYHLIYF